MKAVGLFSGIGGIEVGFRRQGLSTGLLCEVDPAARRVLRHRFPDVALAGDVRELTSLPRTDVVAAGFPCQDLSQAGRTVGISGRHSGLIGEVFRLLATPGRYPEWLVLENVPFMLHLARGRAMEVITTALEERGYRWAYRTVDTLAFGVPQRRRRIVIVGARKSDPRTVLFADDAGERGRRCLAGSPRGFYWTEGRSGIGWAHNAVPPLKGGSGVGIPSSPAIWFPDRRFIGTLDIRDAERLQGFRAGWTNPAAEDERSERIRWRLVGNAVSVPVAAWLAGRLLEPGKYDASKDREVDIVGTWPAAAWGGKGRRYTAEVSAWPVRTPHRGLRSFLRYATVPLSVRAAAGFHARALESSLSFEDRFRIQRRLIPGSTRTVDIVFPRARLAVFVDGCFWHDCPIHGSRPKSNVEWWQRKIRQNVERDQDTNGRLHDLGWRVIRIWEHEDPNEAADRICTDQ